MNIFGKWNTLSNRLTLCRILLTPVVVWSLLMEYWFIALVLSVLAAITDILDGYVARHFEEPTLLGRLLDPIADKIFLLAVFGTLASLKSVFFRVPWWFFFVLLVRELTLVVGSLAMFLKGVQEHIEPTIWGKLTTFSQLVFVLWLLVCYASGVIFAHTTFFVLLIVNLIATCFSCLHYLLSKVRRVRMTKSR